MATDRERLVAFVPPDLKRQVKERADSNRRSVSREMQVLLESALAPAPPQPVEASR